jgi:hypothetical protein
LDRRLFGEIRLSPVSAILSTLLTYSYLHLHVAVNYNDSGFGGLVVSMLPSGTQDRGFAPDRSRRIFPAGKIHSMPSFGGEVK